MADGWGQRDSLWGLFFKEKERENRRRRRGVDSGDNRENHRHTKEKRIPKDVGELSTYPQRRWISGNFGPPPWIDTYPLRSLSTPLSVSPNSPTSCPRDYPQNGPVIPRNGPVIHMPVDETVAVRPTGSELVPFWQRDKTGAEAARCARAFIPSRHYPQMACGKVENFSVLWTRFHDRITGT